MSTISYVIFHFHPTFIRGTVVPWLLNANPEQSLVVLAYKILVGLPMLNTLKLLVNHFRPKTQKDQAGIKTPQGSNKETEQAEHREKLVHVRNHMNELTTTNAFDINAVRQKVHEDLRTSDLNARQKDRASMNKWFNKCDLTDSGSFDITAFQRRMEEMARAEEEVFMEALPAQEDMLMAFGKPEHDFFESEKISLSGVFFLVNPNEDFEEEYSTPLLPMYHCNDEAASVCHEILDEVPIVCEEFDLNFSVEETYEELIADAIPSPIPAFIPVSHEEETSALERPAVKIDASILFEEWLNQESFDPLSVENAGNAMIDSVTETALDAVSDEVLVEVNNLINSQFKETSETNLAANVKPSGRRSQKTSAGYWAESDRLTRFGRRKTSASCSSSRLPALTQIA